VPGRWCGRPGRRMSAEHWHLRRGVRAISRGRLLRTHPTSARPSARRARGARATDSAAGLGLSGGCAVRHGQSLRDGHDPLQRRRTVMRPHGRRAREHRLPTRGGSLRRGRDVWRCDHLSARCVPRDLDRVSRRGRPVRRDGGLQRRLGRVPRGSPRSHELHLSCERGALRSRRDVRGRQCRLPARRLREQRYVPRCERRVRRRRELRRDLGRVPGRSLRAEHHGVRDGTDGLLRDADVRWHVEPLPRQRAGERRITLRDRLQQHVSLGALPAELRGHVDLLREHGLLRAHARVPDRVSPQLNDQRARLGISSRCAIAMAAHRASSSSREVASTSRMRLSFLRSGSMRGASSGRVSVIARSARA
jgi:hypothetical protein